MESDLQVLLDKPDRHWDSIISDFVLRSNEVDLGADAVPDLDSQSSRDGSGLDAPGLGRHSPSARHGRVDSPSHANSGANSGGTSPDSTHGPSTRRKSWYAMHHQSPLLRQGDTMWNLSKLKAYIVYVCGMLTPTSYSVVAVEEGGVEDKTGGSCRNVHVR